MAFLHGDHRGHGSFFALCLASPVFSKVFIKNSMFSLKAVHLFIVFVRVALFILLNEIFIACDIYLLHIRALQTKGPDKRFGL